MLEGSKNFLFIEADSGGERAAMYSLIGSTKLNGIDPQAYLRYVLPHITDHLVNRIMSTWRSHLDRIENKDGSVR